MANTLYPMWKQALMSEGQANKGLDQPDTVNGPYAALLSVGGSGYVYSSTHQYYTDLTGIISTPTQITSPSVAGGLFTGSSIIFVSVGGGAVVGGFVIYRPNSAANSTWRLVLYEDTGIVGFPITPNGGNIIMTWSPSGIFQL